MLSASSIGRPIPRSHNPFIPERYSNFGHNTPAVHAAKPKRLHVSNIPFKMNSVDLEFVFAPFGVVSEAEIISNAKGSKGFGFVTFIRERDADQAKSLLHHTVIDGRVIEVNDALPRNKFRICPSPALLRFNMQERNQVLANLSARHTLVGPQSAAVQQQPLHRSAPIDVPEADSEWYRQVRQALTQRVQHFSSSADLLTPVSSASPAGSPDSASPIMEYRLFR